MNSILKGMTVSSASRKLLSTSEPATAPEPRASEPVLDVKSQLRQNFSEELAQLRKETAEVAKNELRAKFEQELLEAKKLQSLELEKKVAAKVASLSNAEIALVQATEKINALVEQHIELLETVTREIAFACISKLLGDQKHYEQAITDLVRQALTELGGEKLVQIRVNVDDYKVLTANANASDWLPFVTPDENLAVAECVVNSINSSIDASLSTQLENLRSVLLADRSGA